MIPTGAQSSREALLDELLLAREVERFLYLEAQLLDERRFDEWLDLLAEDLRYWMPLRRNVPRERLQDESTMAGRDMCWFDEDKPTLRKRVQQIATGVHWAEEPMSRICHLVTNIQLLEIAEPEVRVACRFLVYRNRQEDETDVLVGRRHDTLRRAGDSWQIAQREILLEQNVLLAKNLTFFL